ncbi:MAG: BatA domain-containing protein [Gemmatimonadales bacterium]
MTFLHPLALLGLAAAAIPALLHLLERRVPPEAEFPPIRYLSEAERQNARRLKLRHLLLLILRTVLIALIALAAARPLVPSRSGGAGGAGAHEPTALTVILDNSPSSGLVVDGRPALDRLKDVARASIARAGPGDRLWLMLADGVARAGPREELLATLDGARPAVQRLDLTAGVARAARLVDAEPLPAREVHVVSDLQRTALGEGRVDVPRGVRVLALAPAAPPPSNRGIAAARLADGALAITAVGTSGAAPASVVMQLRGRDAGRALVVPGASVSIPLPALAPGWWLGEVTLDPDELRADDRRVFAWRVAPPARVRAEPGAGPFVSAALAVLVEGRRVAAGAEGGAGGPADVSIGERPQSGAGQSVVLPPADPALVGPANRALAARGVRWRFGAVGTPGPIAADSFLGIAGISVIRRYHLEEMGRGGDPRDRGDDGAVLATVNGDPWLARDGDVVLLGSRLDTAWTALPAAPAFVPFVDALVNRLTRGAMPVVEREGAPRVEFQTRGTDTVGAIVYGPDPRESDLTLAAADLVRRAMGAEVLDDAQFAAERFAGMRRLDVSGLLLALALILAAVELGVATLTH